MIDALIIIATVLGFCALGYVIYDIQRFSREDDRLREKLLRDRHSSDS